MYKWARWQKLSITYKDNFTAWLNQKGLLRYHWKITYFEIATCNPHLKSKRQYPSLKPIFIGHILFSQNICVLLESNTT